MFNFHLRLGSLHTDLPQYGHLTLNHVFLPAALGLVYDLEGVLLPGGATHTPTHHREVPIAQDAAD